MKTIIPLHDTPDSISESWQFYQISRNVMGTPLMRRIYGNRNSTLITRWGQNPRFGCDARPNPMDWLSTHLMSLRHDGEDELVLGGLNILAAPLNLHVVDDNKSEPTHDDLHAEYLESFTAHALLWEIAKSGDEHPNAIHQQIGKAIEELHRFDRLYRNTWTAKQESKAMFSLGKSTDNCVLLRSVLNLLREGKDHGDDDKAQGEDPGAAAC